MPKKKKDRSYRERVFPSTTDEIEAGRLAIEVECRELVQSTSREQFQKWEKLRFNDQCETSTQHPRRFP